MADIITYDTPGLYWDMPGLRYDEPAPHAVPIRMKKIKLGIGRSNPDDTAAFTETIVSAMTGNANFPTPDPALTTLANAAQAIRDKKLEITNMEAGLKAARDQLATLSSSAKDEVRKMANYVENKSDGAVDKIHSAGFSVKDDPEPRGPLSQVQNLRVQFSDNEGQLEGRYNTVPGAAMYVVETATNPEGPWAQAAITTRTTLMLTDLTPGTKYWVRVRAIGSSGVGPWSDPACKMAA